MLIDYQNITSKMVVLAISIYYFKNTETNETDQFDADEYSHDDLQYSK